MELTPGAAIYIVTIEIYEPDTVRARNVTYLGTYLRSDSAGITFSSKAEIIRFIPWHRIERVDWSIETERDYGAN